MDRRKDGQIKSEYRLKPKDKMYFHTGSEVCVCVSLSRAQTHHGVFLQQSRGVGAMLNNV